MRGGAPASHCMTMEPRPLPYASGRAQIAREGDGLVVVFPRDESGVAFWTEATTLAVLSVAFFVWTVWPAGATRVGSGVVTHPGGVAVRTVCLATAIGLALSFWGHLRTRHIRSSLELRGGTLVYRRPGVWGLRVTRYDLAHYIDVDVIESDDGETVSLRLLSAAAAADALPEDIATRSSTKSAQAELETVADALRQAVWPQRAATRTRRSTFTRTGPDSIESDKGFAVRVPEPGRVEYSQDGKTMSLRVQRGWFQDHAMCFVIDGEGPRRWDGEPPDFTLPAETQREILHNLREALSEWGVRVLVGETNTRPETEPTR
jgi:hypothetical protein